ncbi:ABC transporter ATP-binding protein [Paenibacillus sp. FSL K6-3166]|uniref:ABC transporter ATP-binding protein n=1 Tax=unclassified Paenibacillus TaxID=185978 RepID=UPI000BA08D8F|nr:ABC transporter ATP-binding protein [Paenibacillus sp. VTT E-133291]OZQ92332.1 ABC transporter ATP-binding protein [Paenibacillus sp. VTT E-133291]
MEENAIELTNITKIYKLYNNPKDRLLEALTPFRTKKHTDFHALNNVTLKVKKGETVGFIGKNGAGKSTLLKIITGILTPTSGKVDVNGRISALLELGAGFNPEYTGLENIYLYGSLMGYDKEETESKVDSILEFADIGDFIHQPVKSYSSGMFVRLAFACAVNVDPEILIVDEALSVGDIRFQQKCYRKIREFKERGTVLFVSHDLGAIANFCDRVIWFNEGMVHKDGLPEDIIDEYHAFMTYDTVLSEIEDLVEDSGLEEEREAFNRSQEFGEKGAVITNAKLLNSSGIANTFIAGGEDVDLLLKVETYKLISMPIIGFVLKDKLGNSVLIVNTDTEKSKISDLKQNNQYYFKWSFAFPYIRDGIYSIDLAIADGTYESHVQQHWISDALLIDVRNKRSYSYAQGFCILDKVKFELI